MDLKITDQTALVTGSTAGIGFAIQELSQPREFASSSMGVRRRASTPRWPR